MKRPYGMEGEGHSSRAVAWKLSLAHVTVMKYLRYPDTMRPKPHRTWESTLKPYAQEIDRRSQPPGLEWCEVVAQTRVRGTAHWAPWEILSGERLYLVKLPCRSTLTPYSWKDRTVSKDGFVS